MERVVVTISSDLFDETDQEASLRKNLSVRSLIAETLKEFNLPEGQYAVRLKGANKPLEPEKTMEQIGILTGGQLIFTRERRMMRQVDAPIDPRTPGGVQGRRSITGTKMASLHADTGQVFELHWSPALVGRPEANTPAGALAVNLADMPEARTVSRPHGSITERDGVYLVESLAQHNLVRLNGEEIQMGERRSLRNGDELMFGKILLTFKLKDVTS
jgi:hypothetical protein